MDEKELESHLAVRLTPTREQALREWLPSAIQQIRERIDSMSLERRNKLLQLALQPELEAETKEQLLREVREIEAKVAEMSDSLEAFQEAQRSLPERLRPEGRLEMR